MITAEIMETAARIALTGVEVAVQPDGSMKFTPISPASTRGNAARCARYREAKRVKTMSNHVEPCQNRVSDTFNLVGHVNESSPSPFPSFPPSLPSPNPPTLSPSHTPLSAPPPVQRTRKAPGLVDDETWLQTLEANAAYAGINIRQELGKCQTWCSVRNLEASRKRFVNWLNNAHKPLGVIGLSKPPPRPSDQSDVRASNMKLL